MKEGLDVLLVHPRLVQTGLDLVDFPTIVWHEVEYSVYTMRQASRRSWRVGQRLPVRVVYLAYRGPLQTQALTLVAKKLQASFAVEGELTEDGLASFSDDDEDLLLALAPSLTEQVEASDDSLEGPFAGLRESEQDFEAPLGEPAVGSTEDSDIQIVPAAPASKARAEIPVRSKEAAELTRLAGPQQMSGQQLRLL